MAEEFSERIKPKLKIVWTKVVFLTTIHTLAICGAIMTVSGRSMWQTLIFAWLLHLFGGIGVTAGAHRLWSHQTYKAKAPLRFFLLTCHTLAFQSSVWEWVRDHRIHHKYSETDADPYNAKRGAFFSHIGWLMVRKHELAHAKGKLIDMNDIESDPVLMLQKKYQLRLGFLLCFMLPTVFPWIVWDESLLIAFLTAAALRLAFTWHVTWLVNSAAHLWGSKPYDKEINPSENKVVNFFSAGEGYHNYHHVFPWDYKASELGTYFCSYGSTTAFIDFCAFIGLAYDLKTVPNTVVELRAIRTGDGSYHN